MELLDNEKRLNSWKEIGVYLERDARTARRWEQEEGLPVHRQSHKARASVYAFPSELDAWRESRKVLPAAPPPRPLWKMPAFALTMAAALLMVGNGLRPQAAEAASPTLKVLCDQACVDVSDGGVSPNGRYAIGTDWEVNDLVIQDLRSGKTRPFTVRSATDSKKAWPEHATFSANERQIAYLWFTGSGMELRVVENGSGAKPRTFLQNFTDLHGLDWAPDGKRVLACFAEKDKTERLAWVTVADGAVQPVKSLGKRLKGTSKVSPDGRFIAYSATPAAESASKEQRIYVLTADGRTETEVVHAAGVNLDPVWSGDGSHLIFVSNRTGQNSLWSVPVANGKASGPEKLLRTDINQGARWGLTREGSYIFQTKPVAVTTTSVIAMEAGWNRLEGTKPRTVASFIGTSPVWSPDGTKLAFSRPSSNGKDLDLVVRDVTTEAERAYSHEGISGDPARWFPDGKSVLKNGAVPGSSERALYRVDLEKGDFRVIAKFGSDFGVGEGEVSADGKTVFLSGRVPGGELSRLMALNIATGSWRTVFTSPVGGALHKLVLHPDGTRLLMRIQVGKTNHLVTLNVYGTGYREIYRTDEKVTGIAWTRDGNGVLFSMNQNGDWNVMRVPVAGGRAEPLGISLDSAEGRLLLSLNADGTRLAVGSRTLHRETWALEHLASALK